MIPAENLKIVVGKILEDRYVDRIKEEFPGINVVLVDSEEDQDKEIKDADVLFTWILPHDPSIAPGLKWVQFMWEGIDEITEDFRGSKIILTNAGGAHTIPIAEHTFTFILDHEKRSFLYHAYQKNNFYLLHISY